MVAEVDQHTKTMAEDPSSERSDFVSEAPDAG